MYPSALKTKIITPKLDETRGFYIRCLGMRVVEEWREADDAGCILALAGGEEGAFLEIYEGPEGPGFAGLNLQFRTNDLAGFRSLVPAGVEVRGPVKRPWGTTYLYLADPNGIAVMVYEGGL